jgi:hypothetical protein
MDSHKEYSTPRLFIYILSPSFASIVGGLLAATLIVLVHIISISLDTGTILPAYLDGYFATYYTNYVVQPLLSFFHLGIIGVMESVILWSIVGGCIYAIGEYLFYAIKNLYKTETSVQIINNRRVRHPQQWSLITHIIWRLVVGACVALFVFLALPFARYALHLDYQVAAGTLTRLTTEDFLIAVIIWWVIIYLSIIFIRLYTFHTRLFRESINF